MSLRHSRALGAAALGAAVLAPAAALAGPATAARAPSGAVISLHSTGLGRLLVNGRGFTLYAFTRDGRDTDTCVHIGGCARAWPPLTTRGRPLAGAGIRRSLLGTIPLPGGARQVTYDGHALYTYAFDSGPAQTAYVGATAFGGAWPGVRPSGQLAR